MTNLLLATDSYKHSHFLQYPPKATHVSAYVEARKNLFSESLIFFGLQAFLLDRLMKPITLDDVEEAEMITGAHGEPFNKQGWRDIVTKHGGFLPLEIKALPEGLVVPAGVPLIQVENTDPTMPWLTTFIETVLLRGIWYPSTVATLSGLAKRKIMAGLQKTSDDPVGQVMFKLHDFGARGVSSGESAALGGLAHLVNFMGTDTMEALLAARRFYGADIAGFSIPAAEHSTITSWGPAGETDAYANMLKQFSGEGRLVAVVSDSYDLWNAIQSIWGGALKEKVLATGGTLVVRPDSGDPVVTPVKALRLLWEIFGVTVNSKGFKVLHPAVRVIQGDGMNVESIGRLVDRLIEEGFSLDNIAYGMGGGLLQQVNRDTMRFAMKANAIRFDGGAWQDVSKKPATDPTKASLAGRQAVIDVGGQLQATRLDLIEERQNLLKPVWRNGELLVRTTFDEVRQRASAFVS